DKKELITRLRNEYQERVGAKFPADFNETKDWAIKVEGYNKDNEYETQKATKILFDESIKSASDEVDDLTMAFGALKINCVNKKHEEDIQEVKSVIKELTKVVKDLTNKTDTSRHNEQNARL
ncbi:3102_t:CDS:2, partial [Dentiscutata heterogama]